MTHSLGVILKRGSGSKGDFDPLDVQERDSIDIHSNSCFKSESKKIFDP